MAELVNKINGPWFSKFDEDLATAFSIYCGISIAHVRARGGGVSPTWGGGRGDPHRSALELATARRDGAGGTGLGGRVRVVSVLWGQAVVAMGWDGMGGHTRGAGMCWGGRGGLAGAGGCCPPPALPYPPPTPQSLLYKKVNEAQYRSHLANEMMMYHMKVRWHRDGWGQGLGTRAGTPTASVVPPHSTPGRWHGVGGSDTPGLSALAGANVAKGTAWGHPGDPVTGNGSRRCRTTSTPSC